MYEYGGGEVLSSLISLHCAQIVEFSGIILLQSMCSVGRVGCIDFTNI